MSRVSLYDRISEKRLANEALAREEAERAAIEQVQAEPEVDVAPPKPMLDTPSSFNFGGFEFGFPQGLTFSTVDVVALMGGEPIAISVQRRPLLESATLNEVFAESTDELGRRYPGLRIIRQRDSSLAGNPAMTVDFMFRAGHEERHGRFVGAIVPVADRNERQWLSVSCLIDPEKPALKGWLLDLDDMISGLAHR